MIRLDWTATLVWAVILLSCFAFWAAVGYGIWSLTA
jgi:hypothetical protein